MDRLAGRSWALITSLHRVGNTHTKTHTSSAARSWMWKHHQRHVVWVCVCRSVCVWAWIYYIAVNEWLRLFQSMWSECVRVCVRLNRGNEAAFSLCHVAQSLRVCKWHKFTHRYTCEDLHWHKGRQSKQVLQRSDHRASDRAVSKSGRNDHTSHLVYHLNKHFGQLMASVTGIRSYWIKHDVLSILFTGRRNRGWNRVCV